MERKGIELIFVSRIAKDGSATTKPTPEDVKFLEGQKFNLSSLSISEGTFVASGMSSYVVKLKDWARKLGTDYRFVISLCWDNRKEAIGICTPANLEWQMDNLTRGRQFHPQELENARRRLSEKGMTWINLDGGKQLSFVPMSANSDVLEDPTKSSHYWMD